ncbi:MAG: hypothetical protein ACXV2H_07185 [Actinomycetes bacterium]
MPDKGRTPSPIVTPEQVALALWWLAAPDDATAGEARQRFAAVGVHNHDHAPRQVQSPACRVDGHGRRCIVDRYDTVLLHESGPGEWSLNLHPNGLEWSVLVDLADAIKQAQAEGVSE